MKTRLWVLGAIILMSPIVFSFFPVFQNFQEENYTIPPFRGEDYPNFQDLIIMNVYMECGKLDNFYVQFPSDGIQYCSIAQKWVFGLLSLVAIGFTTMIVVTFRKN